MVRDTDPTGASDERVYHIVYKLRSVSADCFDGLEHVHFIVLDDLLDGRACCAVDTSTAASITVKHNEKD